MTGVALIGVGMVAQTHLNAIADAQNITLVGVLGRSAGRLSAFLDSAEATLGYQLRRYADVSDIAADDDVDMAIIVTPPDTRKELVETLITAKKPILMEKPIERTLNAATDIVASCQAADVPLGIVLQHRAREASQALKSALDTGVLGSIATVDIKVPWWRDQSYYDAPGRGSYARDGGGVMISQAVHTLDLVLWLLGPMRAVQAMMATTKLHRLEAEDWAGAVFEMASGAVGTMMATTAAYPGDAESIELQGTKAHAVLKSGVLTITPFEGSVQTYGATASTGGGADPMAFSHDWHQSILEDFVNAMSQGTPPLASGRSALMAHAVIEAMERSARTGTRIKMEPT